MRLQVSVRRHGLPPVNIIFTTGAGPASKTLSTNATVTDFLQDINDLVPLESADGEWGLEDYVVEVQATADQDFAYECLHFQHVGDVLQEDDEVVIRALSTEDLRARRLGGRHQISTDGRHLVDGVAFGRQWLRTGGRPALNIPPRKKRRLEIDQGNDIVDEESTTLLEQIQQIGYSLDDLDNGSEEEEDEEEEDDDYEESDEDNISGSDGEDQPRRIKATAEFDDADVEEEGSDHEVSDEDFIPAIDLQLSDELKALLEEAEQLSESGDYQRLPSEATQSPRKRKRRIQQHQSDTDVSEFEGFSTPAKPNMLDSLSISLPLSGSSSDESASTTSSSGSDTDSDGDIEPLLSETSSSGPDTSETSDSDTSDEESESEMTSSDSSSSDSSSNEEVDTKGVTLPPSSPAKKDSAISQPVIPKPFNSSENQVQGIPGEGLNRTKRKNDREKKKRRLAFLKREGLLYADANFEDLAALEIQLGAEKNADGRVDHAELLDAGTSIDERKAELLGRLEAHEEPAEPSSHSASETGTTKHRNLTSEISNSSLRLTQSQSAMEVGSNSQAPNRTKQVAPFTLPNQTVIEQSVGRLSPQETDTNQQDNPTEKAAPSSTEKRAKLDLASTRRMLFSSLGLRNPKTPEAEIALREKLNSSAKSNPQRRAEEKVALKAQMSTATDLNEMNSWTDKITLSAVECEHEGTVLSTPPFPFKQGWDSNANMRRGTKRKVGRGDSRYYNQYVEDEENNLGPQYPPDGSIPVDESKIAVSQRNGEPESRTLSLEEREGDDIPLPADFESLPVFDPGVLPRGGVGALIAFKEFEIEGYQPVISPYRVARVQSVTIEEDSTLALELMLAKRDWKTGGSGPNPFVVEGADGDQHGEPDRGYRLRIFTSLIEPKLVDASTVQVSASPAQTLDTDRDKASALQQDPSLIAPEREEVVQESVESEKLEKDLLTMTHVEVNTPRRNEIAAIIRDSGFDSAIDKTLLPRKPTAATDSQSSPAFHTRSHSPGNINLRSKIFNAKKLRLESFEPENLDSSSPHSIPSGSRGPSASRDTPQANVIKSSVGYPSLSQLELDATGVSVTNDSSFQDGQNISQPQLETDTSMWQANLDLDTSKLHPEYPYDDFGETTQLSLGSEVPQSSSSSIPPSSQPMVKSKERNETEQSQTNGSFLEHGLDGQASSDDDEEDANANNYVEDDSDDASDSSSSSFPSLTELTSSQHAKIRNASRRSRVTPPTSLSAREKRSAIISPPPTNRLRKGKNHSISPNPDTSLPTSAPQPPLSQVQLPIKASQSSQPRLSQIPTGSQLIDLTFSSDPAEDPSDDDGEYHAPKTRGSRNRKKTPLTTAATAAGRSSQASRRSVSAGKGSEEGPDSGRDEDNEDNIGAGIGKRRFLTTKRARSYV